jgi:hypothetical protein
MSPMMTTRANSIVLNNLRLSTVVASLPIAEVAVQAARTSPLFSWTVLLVCRESAVSQGFPYYGLLHEALIVETEERGERSIVCCSDC